MSDQEAIVLEAAAAILRARGRDDIASAIARLPQERRARANLRELKCVMMDRINAELERQQLTPIKAATRAGLPRDTFRNMFRVEATFPRVDTLALMAGALGVRMAYLIGEEDRT